MNQQQRNTEEMIKAMTKLAEDSRAALQAMYAAIAPAAQAMTQAWAILAEQIAAAGLVCECGHDMDIHHPDALGCPECHCANLPDNPKDPS